MDNNTWPKLKFYGGFNQQDADNAEQKGVIGGILVEFEMGKWGQGQLID